MKRALIIGNSDGIGLALTRRLLKAGWAVTGISRSPMAPDALADDSRSAHHYQHYVADIDSDAFTEALEQACVSLGDIDTCVYCAGVGQEIDLKHLARERQVFQVNLMGAVTTLEIVLPRMLLAGRGHFIGLSSQADGLRDPYVPSYVASKAGLSAYLEAMDKAVRPHGVAITNVRFGFVDTKMAKSEARPFIISAAKAATLIERCMRKRPRTYTHPRRMAALLWFVRLFGC